ncbi:MAG: MATE family efflux transporter [Pseudomonadota bacterium]
MASLYTKFSPWEINKLFKLLIPLVLTGFIESSVGFFSTLFLAHLGTKELAAGAVVQWIFFTLMVILWGTLTSISVLISQKHGMKDEKGIVQVLFDGLVLSILMVVPAYIILKNIVPLLLFIGQDATMVVYARDYLHGLSWALLPDFVGLMLLQFLIGLGHTRTTLIFSLMWVPLNIFFNYGLIFGKFGFPALGMGGIGWGTALAYWVSTLLLIVYMVVNQNYRRYFKALILLRETRYLKELCQIGLPMGMMYCIEIAFFLVLTLLMGRISSEELAANQIALQFMGQTSIMTFSIAQAVTVRMGHALGANHPAQAERAAYIGIGFALSFMFVVAMCYWIIPEKLIALDLNIHLPQNTVIVGYAVKMLMLCGVFEMLEAVRFILFGALRGLKDTRYTLLVSIISFWVVSLPLGYLLANQFNLGGQGLWLGTLVGATVGITMLVFRFRVKMRQQFRIMDRLQQEHKMPVENAV